jgi:hypothetical protein
MLACLGGWYGYVRCMDLLATVDTQMLDAMTHFFLQVFSGKLLPQNESPGPGAYALPEDRRAMQGSRFKAYPAIGFGTSRRPPLANLRF